MRIIPSLGSTGPSFTPDQRRCQHLRQPRCVGPAPRCCAVGCDGPAVTTHRTRRDYRPRMPTHRGTRAPRRWCRPRPAACRRGSAAPARTQRDAAGVAGRALDAVEGDLDDLLGTDVTTWPSRYVSSSRNRSVCHASISSVMPLNVLPSITNPPVAGRARRGGCWTASPGAGRCPTRPEHDQVEGVPRLHLDPARPAPAGLVRRVEALTTTPSWPSATPRSKNACGLRGSAVTNRRARSSSGTRSRRAGEPFGGRRLEHDRRRWSSRSKKKRAAAARRLGVVTGGGAWTPSPGTAAAGRRRRA